jgi:hypothetical protein
MLPGDQPPHTGRAQGLQRRRWAADRQPARCQSDHRGGAATGGPGTSARDRPAARCRKPTGGRVPAGRLRRHPGRMNHRAIAVPARLRRSAHHQRWPLHAFAACQRLLVRLAGTVRPWRRHPRPQRGRLVGQIRRRRDGAPAALLRARPQCRLWPAPGAEPRARTGALSRSQRHPWQHGWRADAHRLRAGLGPAQRRRVHLRERSAIRSDRRLWRQRQRGHRQRRHQVFPARPGRAPRGIHRTAFLSGGREGTAAWVRLLTR